MERKILHSDMNCFYASVETMLNPALRGKPVAVCGATEERHGIVLAKSEAAKKAGIKTGMVNWQARQLCPDLIVVPPQYDQYLKYSKLAHEIYYRYTDRVEPYGMDECWLDVSGADETGECIAQQIRRTVREELGLTVSVGVSFNKIFAKLGSDMKKPDAVTVITGENFRELVWPLPASELLYVGSATSRKLEMRCIHTIGELAAADPERLRSWFGINGLMLWRFANGLDESRVMHKDFCSPIKSVGHGITCNADLRSNEEVWRVMLALTQDIGHKLRVHGLTAHGVRVAVRTNDLSGASFQCKLPLCTQLPNELARAAFRLYSRRFTLTWERPVRAVTVTATDLQPRTEPIQLTLFECNERRANRERLEDAVEDIRSRFGKSALTYGTLLQDLKMPTDGRCEVIMPGAIAM